METTGKIVIFFGLFQPFVIVPLIIWYWKMDLIIKSIIAIFIAMALLFLFTWIGIEILFSTFTSN